MQFQRTLISIKSAFLLYCDLSFGIGAVRASLILSVVVASASFQPTKPTMLKRGFSMLAVTN